MIEITKPTLKDIPKMINIVTPQVESGIILERSVDEMANAIRSYSIAKVDGEIVGFCALHIHSYKLAEIRSLVVANRYQNIGVGREIVLKAQIEAISLGVEEILVLTYAASFFKKLGYIEISKDEIPDSKIWVDCIKCKHFPICDEIALIKRF